MLAPDGHTYERAAIESWLREHPNSSPITGTEMPPGELRPNYTVRGLLHQVFEQEAREPT